jgi:hypothetical protein
MKAALKQLLLALALIVAISGISAQAENTRPDSSGTVTPNVLIGLGLGINDYGFGLGLEVPIMKNLSVYADLGVGGWGRKACFGANYHFQQITKGSVISLGIANASGLKNYEYEMMVEPDGETQNVKMNLNVLNTVNVKYTYNFKLGKKSKFGLSAGYSVPLSGNNFTVLTPGVKLTKESEAVLNMMQPGGLIFGFRFLFGIGQKE